MNYLPNASEVFEFILFTDDTGLYSTIEYSIPITRTNVNETLKNEDGWGGHKGLDHVQLGWWLHSFICSELRTADLCGSSRFMNDILV